MATREQRIDEITKRLEADPRARGGYWDLPDAHRGIAEIVDQVRTRSWSTTVHSTLVDVTYALTWLGIEYIVSDYITQGVYHYTITTLELLARADEREARLDPEAWTQQQAILRQYEREASVEEV